MKGIRNLGKCVDLSGMIYGNLLVLERAGSDKYKKALWNCQCLCGNTDTIIVSTSALKSENTTSCGCVKKKRVSETHRKYNTYDLSGIYGIGRTVENKEFYFDLEDYDKIKDYYWSIHKNGYIINQVNHIFLHKYVMDCPKELQTDHINHKLNDCRKQFLRICTNQENNFNKDKYNNNTSGYKGVYLDKRYDKWFASIKYDNKNIFLDYHDTPEKANEARKKADAKYFGEFSYKEDILFV